MQELYDLIGKWVHDQFPKAGAKEHLLKMRQEADEAIERPKDIIELADCLICLLGAANKNGFCLEELIEATHDKLFINKQRTWHENKDGTHQHK